MMCTYPNFVVDIDEQANVDYFEYVDIQKIDFTKRPPPSLFEEDRISGIATLLNLHIY